jgi:hypothetical protein
MLQAVKDGHLITWPGLTEDAINKHLKLTPATAMGHMNQRRQNIQSTTKAPIVKQQPPDTDLGTKNHLVYAVVVDQGQLYTDLTGKFPVRSSKGSYYCWESNPGPRRSGSRARDKGNESSGKNLCARGARRRRKCKEKQIPASSHF